MKTIHRSDDFLSCFRTNNNLLMEGALGERLKREFGLHFDADVAMAGLIYEPNARMALQALWMEYATVARTYDLPFLATTPTRRANRERVSASRRQSSIICDNVCFLRQVQKMCAVEMYIGGLMGCKGDAYKGTDVLNTHDAREFHSWQANLFRQVEVDFLYAGIMPALTEAMGMAQAMEQTELPYIISFMIRRDGCLIDGTTIHAAIEAIDSATGRPPLCYMTNCVHPTILAEALSQECNCTVSVRERFKGIQANTSALSPEELDGSCNLRSSTPELLVEEMMRLKQIISLKIWGGCCGTDASHMNAIAQIL